MPDPRQSAVSTQSGTRGLKFIRAFGRRLARQEKNESGNESPSPSSKYKEKDSSSDNTENSEEQRHSDSSSDDSSQYKNKQTSSSETSSERTSDSEAVALLSVVLKRLGLNKQQVQSPKNRKKPKSILRRPVCHAHVRGISGLPTQRVPVSRGYYRCPHNYRHYHQLSSSAGKLINDVSFGSQL